MKKIVFFYYVLLLVSCNENRSDKPDYSDNLGIEYWVEYKRNNFGQIKDYKYNSVDSLVLNHGINISRPKFNSMMNYLDQAEINDTILYELDNLEFNIIECFESDRVSNRKWFNILFFGKVNNGIVYCSDIGICLRYTGHWFEYLLMENKNDNIIMYNDILLELNQFEFIPKPLHIN